MLVKTRQIFAFTAVTLLYNYLAPAGPEQKFVDTFGQFVDTQTVKPASEYRIFGRTHIFVSNIRFGFVCQFNILIGFPNIRSKDASSGSCSQ